MRGLMKRKSFVFLVVVLAAVFFDNFCFAEENELDLEKGLQMAEMNLRVWRNLTQSELDRDEITSWTLVPSELLHYGADYLVGDSFWRAVCAIPLLIVLEIPLSGASHEYGHFRIGSLAGMDQPQFINEDNPNDRYNANPFNTYTRMFRQLILMDGLYAVGQSDDAWEKFLADPRWSAYWLEYEIMTEASGLNQQQYNAETLAGKVLDGNAHPLDAITVISNLLATITYPVGENSDIVDYIHLLRERGIKTNVKQIKLYSQLPKLASNSALSLTRALVGYLDEPGTDSAVKPLALVRDNWHFYWPEFSSYLTLYGPTIKLSQSNRWRNQIIYFSLENSLSKNIFEVGLGWKLPIANFLTIEPRIIHNFQSGSWLDNNWFEIETSAKIYSWLALGFKAYGARGYTFQRDITGQEPSFLEKREFGLKGFLAASFSY